MQSARSTGRGNTGSRQISSMGCFLAIAISSSIATVCFTPRIAAAQQLCDSVTFYRIPEARSWNPISVGGRPVPLEMRALVCGADYIGPMRHLKLHVEYRNTTTRPLGFDIVVSTHPIGNCASGVENLTKHQAGKDWWSDQDGFLNPGEPSQGQMQLVVNGMGIDRADWDGTVYYCVIHLYYSDRDNTDGSQWIVRPLGERDSQGDDGGAAAGSEGSAVAIGNGIAQSNGSPVGVRPQGAQPVPQPVASSPPGPPTNPSSLPTTSTNTTLQAIGDLINAHLQSQATSERARLQAAGAEIDRRVERANREGGRDDVVNGALRGDTTGVASLVLLYGRKIDGIDQDGETALLAVGHKHPLDLGMQTYLLDHGANPNAEDTEGVTPLFWARFGGHGLQRMLLLLSHGANPFHRPLLSDDDYALDVYTDAYHQPDLLYLIHHLRNRDGQVAQALQQMLPVGQDATDLNYAASMGDRTEVARLLARGISVDARDRFSFTPLQNAAESGDTAMVDFLLGRGADLNAVNAFGFSSVMLASMRLGADYENAGHPDVSSLKWFGVVEHLLTHGANTKLKEMKGKTAADLANNRNDLVTDKWTDSTKDRYHRIMDRLRH